MKKIIIILLFLVLIQIKLNAAIDGLGGADTTKPHILFRGEKIVNNMEIAVQVNWTFSDTAIYAYDTGYGRITCNRTPGFNGAVNSSVRGVYPIAYSATDSAGNPAVENNYVINFKVDDYISPVITLNTPDTVCHQINTPYISIKVTVTDNYYDSNQITIQKTGTVNAYKEGTYTERFTALDGSGNLAVQNRHIKVMDCNGTNVVHTNIKPEILVYPVPANAFIYIKPDQFKGKSLYIQIKSVAGSLELEKTVAASEKTAMDVSEIPAGTYFITIKSDNEIYQQKLLVIHN